MVWRSRKLRSPFLSGFRKADCEFARNESAARDGPSSPGTDVIVVTDNVRITAVSGRIARDDAGFRCRGAAICVAAAYAAVVDGDPDKADGDEAGARRDDRTRPCRGLIDRICDGPTQALRDSPTRSAERYNASALEGRLPEPAIIVPWLLPCIRAAGFIFYASIYQCATLRKDARSDLLIYQDWLSCSIYWPIEQVTPRYFPSNLPIGGEN
jgi:hypothetical protein